MGILSNAKYTAMPDALSTNTQAPRSEPPPEASATIDQLRVQLMSTLQRSLDVQQLVEIFCEQMQQLFGLCGGQFTAQEPALQCQFGATGIHNFHYRLNTPGEQRVGELVLYSRRRISDTEMQLFDIAASCLVYPLHNALQYHQAISKAHRDPLTALGNRLALDAALQRESSRALRNDSDLSLLIIDIDHFKSINDCFGHSAGDAVIVAVANALSETARKADNVFRYGGEEFIVLLDNTDREGAEIAAERFRQRVASIEASILGMSKPITASIGYATLTPEESMASLIERADAAMYVAKASGRNRACAA